MVVEICNRFFCLCFDSPPADRVRNVNKLSHLFFCRPFYNLLFICVYLISKSISIWPSCTTPFGCHLKIEMGIITLLAIINFLRRKDPAPIFGKYSQRGKWFYLKYIVFLCVLYIRKVSSRYLILLHIIPHLLFMNCSGDLVTKRDPGLNWKSLINHRSCPRIRTASMPYFISVAIVRGCAWSLARSAATRASSIPYSTF